jgi:hypothetical protein
MPGLAKILSGFYQDTRFRRSSPAPNPGSVRHARRCPLAGLPPISAVHVYTLAEIFGTLGDRRVGRMVA